MYLKLVIKIACLLVAVFIYTPSLAQETFYVKSGVYATEVYDIDFQKEQFNVQFWIWFIHGDAEYRPWERTEITNAKSFSIVSYIRERRGEQFFDSLKIKAVVRGLWNIEQYPFDTQKLIIDIEDNQQTVDFFRFIVDALPSGIDLNTFPQGWSFNGKQILSKKHQYGTTFGDPELQKSQSPEYSQLRVVFELERKGHRLFIVLFIGFILAWMLTILVYVSNCWYRLASVLKVQDLLNISIGALFAAMSNSFTLSNRLPYTTHLVLADHFQLLTLANLIFAMMLSIGTQTALHPTHSGTELTQANKHRLLVRNRWLVFIWLSFCSATIGLRMSLFVS